MARQPRVYIEDVAYYVTSRSGHSENLFLDEGDYKEYISLVAKYKEQYGFKLFSYVLLPTHLHMLIELRNNIGISNIMHDINSLYTKSYNSKYSKKGHLFQARFRTVIAEKEEYLLPLIKYIHLNPKRQSLVDDPNEYPYSSHSQLMDPGKRAFPNIEMETEEIFRYLEGREKELNDYIVKAEKEETDQIKKLLHRKSVVGSPQFVNRISKIIEESTRGQKEEETPRKFRIIYTIIGGAAIVILAVMVSYFYKQATELKTEYNATLELYRKTLDTLETEKAAALKQDKTIEEYEWKIKLTEKAIKELETQTQRAQAERKALDGYVLSVEMTPLGDHRQEAPRSDALYFVNNRMTSESFRQEGFPMSNYSQREDASGAVVWETMQVDAKGDVANWHGEWDGATMKGVVSKRTASGEVRDFSFVSKGERLRNK